MKTAFSALIAVGLTLAAVIPASAGFGPKNLPEIATGFGPSDLPGPATGFGPKDLPQPEGGAYSPWDGWGTQSGSENK